MAGRDAVQRQCQQRLVDRFPEDERRLDAVLGGEVAHDGGAVAAVVQLRQAGRELGRAAALEVGAVQVGRAAVERVEEGAGDGAEDGVPAQQAEQGVDQRVFHVVDGGVVARQVVAHDQLHVAGLVRRRQAQVDAPGLDGRGGGGLGVAQAARQARRHAQQLQAFRLALRLGPRRLQQGVGRLRPAILFQHADGAGAGAGVGAVRVQRMGGGPVLLLFQLLGDLEQQTVAPAVQPFVVGRAGRQAGQHLGRVLAGQEAFAALVQLQVVVDVAPGAETARGRRERHLLVLVDAQVRQHELGPVLVVIAEEDETQPVAQGLGDDVVDLVARIRIPGRKAVDTLVAGAQRVQLFRLAQRFFLGRELEQMADFRLLQQLEQLLQRQHGIGRDPALFDQWGGGGHGIADFRVGQLAGTKQLALAHHHAHEQGAGRLGQGGEAVDEGALVGRQQVVVAFAYPRQDLMEVIQIVKRVFQDFDHCGGRNGGITVSMYSLSCPAPLAQHIRSRKTP